MNGLARILGSILAANASQAYDEDEIRYGIEVFLGGLLQTLLLLFVGWWLGILKELLAVMLSFALVRRYAGGAHCTAFYRCTLIGLITFPVLAFLARYIPTVFFYQLIILVAIFTSIIVFLKAPQDTAIKPIDDENQRQRLRQRALILSWLVLTASLVLFAEGYHLLSMGALLGLFWQAFTMTRWGAFYVRCYDILLSNWWAKRIGKEEF